MKVRYKQPRGSTEWIVVEESPTFYIGHPVADGYGPAELSLLRKAHYEPVQEETWRDVTAECELNPGTTSAFLHDGEQIYKDDGYRLRKVAVNEAYDNHEYAFIIEKREP